MTSNKTKKGLVLRSIEAVSSQVCNFVLQMVLARILIPEDFGVVGILSIFTNIANTCVNNGLGSALVQRKHIKQVDICTVFFLELGIALLMYSLIFLFAPFIATAYENPLITTYLRVFALTIVLSPFTSIQTTVGRHRLDFKPSLIANIMGMAAHAIVGITMALNGFGVWSLIYSQIASYAVRTVMMTILVRWLPSFQFSMQSLKSLFSYSWKLFAGWMVGTLYQDAFSMIIGGVYDATTLGYYSKGHSIPSYVNKIATQVTTAVMFPSIAKAQDDKNEVKKQTRQMISVTCAIILPIMAGLAATAPALVQALLTEKWLGAVPVIQIMCIPLSLNVISNANMQTFNAMGRSDVFLRTEMIKRGLTILLVFIFAHINYYLMLLSICVGGVLSLIVNAVQNRKLLNYTAKEYLTDIIPYLLCALVLFGCVYCCKILNVSYVLCLILQLALCAALYFGMIFGGVLPAFKLIRNTIFEMFLKKRNKGSAK